MDGASGYHPRRPKNSHVDVTNEDLLSVRLGPFIKTKPFAHIDLSEKGLRGNGTYLSREYRETVSRV